MEINIYQDAIEQLVLEGNTILQVIEPNSNSVLYFCVYKFQEGYFNTAQSIDFNTVEGVNITEFLKKNASLWSMKSSFISNFNKVMDNGVCVRCEFSKHTPWYKWSAPMNKKGI